jgi:hypothetical protein
MDAPAARACVETLECPFVRMIQRDWCGMVAGGLQEQRLLVRSDEDGGKVGSAARFVCGDVLIRAIRGDVGHFVAGFVTRVGRRHCRGADFARAERGAEWRREQRDYGYKCKDGGYAGVSGSCCALHHFFTLPCRFPGVNTHGWFDATLCRGVALSDFRRRGRRR